MLTNNIICTMNSYIHNLKYDLFDLLVVNMILSIRKISYNILMLFQNHVVPHILSLVYSTSYDIGEI